MGNSSSKSSSDSGSHTSKVMAPTKRRREYSDTSDLATNLTLSHITGSLLRRRRTVDSIASKTNTASAAPPPYSATEDIPSDVAPRSSHIKNNRHTYVSTVSQSRSAHHISLDPANTGRSLGQASVTMPIGLGSQHTQIYMIPAGANPARSIKYLTRREPVEDALDVLRKYDTVIIVDDSSSMEGAFWNETRDALASLADVVGKYDTDGIDVHFLNAKHFMSNVHQSSTIKQLFEKVQPRGITPIGTKLEELLLAYLANLETAKERVLAGDVNAMKTIKPVNYIILTDGAPTDDPEDVIIAAAKRLDRGNFSVTQVGIQFVQIGNSKKAADFLRELDDSLSANHGVRDIVDTTSYTGNLNAETLIKILLGGINRKVDRKGGSSVMS